MTLEQELARADVVCMWIMFVAAVAFVGCVIGLIVTSILSWWHSRLYQKEIHKMINETIEYNKAVTRGEKKGPYKSVCVGGRRY